MKKINHALVHLKIEDRTFEFEVVGEYYPRSETQGEEFDLRHLYHLKEGDQYTTDYASFLDWDRVRDEVIKQLKAGSNA